jgi:hypothetical protein
MPLQSGCNIDNKPEEIQIGDFQTFQQYKRPALLAGAGRLLIF